MKLLLTSMMAYLRPYWVSVAVVFLAIAVQMSFRMAMPFGYQLAIDRAIPDQDWRDLLRIIAVLAAWWLVQAGFSAAQDARAAKAGIAAINDLRARMFRGLMRLPIDSAARHRAGDLLSRFTVDLAALEHTAVHAIYVFFFSCFNVLASLALLCWFEWRLTLTVLAGLALSALIPKRLAAKAERKSYQRKNEEGGLSAFVQETLGALDIVHAFNLERAKTRELDHKLETFRTKAASAYFLSALVGRLGGQSASLLQVAILALGSYFVIVGAMTLGALVGFLALLQNMVGATSHLAGALPGLIQAAGAMRRVEEFLGEIEANAPEDPAKTLPRLRESLSFREVSFAYGDGDPAVERLNFEIGSGQKVAIVGPSGSGKSTLLKLLLRFYDPQQGVVLWNGADVRHFSRDSLREQISIVPQESTLFDRSLRENIHMGRLDASEDDIAAAAKSAELHDFIRQLPQGYDTPAGERGGRLSGGQRQRVAIARALLRDPALLVLDEATSALDPLTAKAVQNTLIKAAENRTLVSVTHRLNTATAMDRILVMQRGRVVQQGTHQSLLAQKGLYAELWRKQTGFTVSDDGFRAECAPHRLKLIPLFKDLDLPRLKRISESLVSEYFPRDRLVFEKGDYGDKFYIIVNGQVEIADIEGDPNPGEAKVLESGDFFGELALLDQAARNASARTLMPTLLLSLTQQEFQKLLKAIAGLRSAIEQVARERRGRPATSV